MYAAPISPGSIRDLPFGIRVLALPKECDSCALTKPRVELKQLARVGAERWFELPFADGRHGRPTSLSQALDSNGGRHDVTLAGGVSRPEWTDPEDDGSPENHEAEVLEETVAQHIERCQELVYPSQAHVRSRRTLAGGLRRWDWEQARQIYWHPDERDGPLRLIVRIAEECADTLQGVCQRPRKALRRVRELSRLERVQQIDDACVRWLVRQPGRHVLEKAGPRRRVMSVQRVETADTPENRVVRDFLERAITESAKYLREHTRKNASRRYQTVRRFRLLAARLLATSELAEVPKLTGVATPNYVLQFDPRYSTIWTWYERLRRQQSSVDAAWIWRRRMLAERVRFALADGLSRLTAPPHIRHRLYLRADHTCGAFSSAESSLTPWTTATGETLALIPNHEFAEATSVGVLPEWANATAADLIVTRNGAPSELLFVSMRDTESTNERLATLAQEMSSRIDALDIPPPVRAIAVLGDTAQSDDPRPSIATRSGRGRESLAFRVPLATEINSAELTNSVLALSGDGS